MDLIFREKRRHLSSTKPDVHVYRKKSNLGRLFQMWNMENQWALDTDLERKLFQIETEVYNCMPNLEIATHTLQVAEDYRESIQSRIQFRPEKDYICEIVDRRGRAEARHHCKSYTVIFDALEIGKIHSTAKHRDNKIWPSNLQCYTPSWTFDEDLSRFLKLPYWGEPGSENLLLATCKHLVRVRLHSEKLREEKYQAQDLKELVGHILERKCEEIMKFAKKHPRNIPYPVIREDN